MRGFLLLFVLLFPVPVLASTVLYLVHGKGADWRSADRSSSGLLPPAGRRREALVRIFSARTVSWRGIVAPPCCGFRGTATRTGGTDRRDRICHDVRMEVVEHMARALHPSKGGVRHQSRSHLSMQGVVHDHVVRSAEHRDGRPARHV